MGRVLILGLAREGLSLARFFAPSAVVTVTDAADETSLGERAAELAALDVRLVAGGHHPELVRDADRFFVSPGISESNPVYVAAREAGLQVESMTTLFFDLCPSPIVGVTGSSGKTTTTGLIGHILQTAGCHALVGGNIGDPMLDLLPRLGPDSLAVLELSSFQLAILHRSPRLAVVTNISPNHLDRHGTMDEYVRAKKAIVVHQSPDDRAVLNADDEIAKSFALDTPAEIDLFSRKQRLSGGAWVGDGTVLAAGSEVMPVEDIPLLGEHNLENVLAALAATAALGIKPAAQRAAVRSFRPAPHRLQTVAVHNGVTYVNDSIATSPARAMVALRSLSAPIHLIAGGRDKNLPWDEFAALAVDRVQALYLIGEAASLIDEATRAALRTHSGTLLPENIHHCRSLEDAVDMARRRARPGDFVLLSPGCTSYDMFHDFAQRGDAFARAVEGRHAA